MTTIIVRIEFPDSFDLNIGVILMYLHLTKAIALSLLFSPSSLQAQVACPPSITDGSLEMEIVKLERNGGMLGVTYLLKSSYNIPMDISPYHWGHDKHFVKDSNGNDWLYQRYSGTRPNFRMENGDLQRVTLTFVLREGDANASRFNISLNFHALASGGGFKLGQTKKHRGAWRDVQVGCTKQS